MKNKKQLVKKEQITTQQIADSIIGGKVNIEDKDGLPTFIDKDYPAELAKIDPNLLVENITIKDPVSGKTAIYELDRGGTRDQKLAMVLANPEATEEQKMATTSLWLFEKGKESSSFILDLMQSKGTAIRDFRKFESRMQYDWTYFIGMFCSFLHDQAGTILGMVIPGTPIEGVEYDAFEFMKKQKEQDKEPSLHEWAVQRYHQIGKPEATAFEEQTAIMLLEMGVRFASEAQSMRRAMKDMTAEREKAAGKPFPDMPN